MDKKTLQSPPNDCNWLRFQNKNDNIWDLWVELVTGKLGSTLNDIMTTYDSIWHNDYIQLKIKTYLFVKHNDKFK